MRRALVATVIGAATVLAGRPCSAQSLGDFAARTALTQTPIGALPPIATSTIESEVQRAVGLSARYGYLAGTGVSLNNVGITAILPLGIGSTLSLTAGAVTCNACGTGPMLGVGADTRVGEFPFAAGTGQRLVISVNGEFGYGRPSGTTFDHGSLMSGAVGIPISLVAGNRPADGIRVVPFVTPAFGFGEVRGVSVFNTGGNRVTVDSPNGTRVILGGGVGVYNRRSNVAFDFGFQYVPIRNGDVLIGAGLRIGGR